MRTATSQPDGLDRLPLAVALAVFLGVATAEGQIPLEKHTVYPANDETRMGFAWADIDGDGLADLVAEEGGYGGPILWFEATNGATRWQKHTVAEEGPDGTHFCTGDLEVGDFDQDGDVDVLGFVHPGEWTDDYTGDHLPTDIYWYENDGTGDGWAAHAVGTVPDFVKDVEVVRLNGDAWLDVATMTYRDDFNFAVFRRDGGPEAWTKAQDRTVGNIHEGMDSGDIDGDGDVDLAFCGYWAENPGGTLAERWPIRNIAPKWHDQTGDWRKNATKVVCRDITADGRAEVFISHSERAGYPVAWYGTDAPRQAETWAEHVIADDMAAVHTLEVGDVDGDGDADVLAGENGGHDASGDDAKRQVRLYLNRGNAKRWRPLTIRETGLYNGRLHDVDDDGRLDIGGPASHAGTPYHLWLNRRK